MGILQDPANPPSDIDPGMEMRTPNRNIDPGFEMKGTGRDIDPGMELRLPSQQQRSTFSSAFNRNSQMSDSGQRQGVSPQATIPEQQRQSQSHTQVDTSDMGPPPPIPVIRNPQTGEPDKRTIVAMNPEGGTGEYYNDLQKWEPHGAKRGFKNSLKAGLMYASDAVRAHPEDPVTALIAGFGTGALGATAAPNFKNRLKRDWALKSTGQELQNQLGLKKEQAQIGALESQGLSLIHI
jgi:hypothetical protein